MSCHAYERVTHMCHTCEWVMSKICIGPFTHIWGGACWRLLRTRCIMSLIGKRHFKYINTSCHSYDESCHTQGKRHKLATFANSTYHAQQQTQRSKSAAGLIPSKDRSLSPRALSTGNMIPLLWNKARLTYIIGLFVMSHESFFEWTWPWKSHRKYGSFSRKNGAFEIHNRSLCDIS